MAGVMEYTPPVTDPRHKSYVLGWKAAGEALRAVRLRELRDTDTAAALQQLAGAFDDAVRRLPPRSTSGLVEQQRLFGLLAARRGLA